MIVFNYDPIFGLVSYQITEPERVPLSEMDRQDYIKRMFENLVGRRTKLITPRNGLPNVKEKKQNSIVWAKKYAEATKKARAL